MGGRSLTPGSRFAQRYAVEQAAGSGGMGTVYRARDLASPAHPVALKLLHSAVASPEELERFQREAQLLSELDHPNIVRYLQSGRSDDGVPFLAMEWLDGHSLATRLQNGPLSVPDTVTLAVQAADALAFAHRRGVIHRDLNPANLFLQHGEITRLKILDFGIARRVVTDQPLTQTGVILGTPKYLAPEQARGQRQITQAVDLFSLGCVLYECLAGQPPFVADHLAAILARILFEDPPPLEALRPGLPVALAQIVDRLLIKDIDQRQHDAAQLRDQLLALGQLADVHWIAPSAQRPSHSTYFGEQEQRLFSLVVATAPEPHTDTASTLPTSAETPQNANRVALLQALNSLRVSVTFMANGCLIATFTASISAQDSVLQAARVALLVQEHWPTAAIALLTGRGVQQGRAATGEILERALQSAEGLSAQGGGIYVDDLSAQFLRGRFALTVRSDGRVLLHEESDASRPLLGKPTPFVGREAELGTLESQLSGCIEETEARVVLVTGPPGSGKSRLRHELLRRVERHDPAVTVLAGCGDALQAEDAFRVVKQALCQRCGIQLGHSPTEKWRLLQDHIEPLLAAHVADPDRDRVLPLLAELCEIPLPNAQLPTLPKWRQHAQGLPEQLRWAALAWLTAECHATPVLFVLDDLQWVDPLSIQLFDEALASLRHAPLFVVALARPEVHVTLPKLWQRHSLREIALPALSKRACRRLIQQALGSQVSTVTLDWISDQSGGNALFLEELIRSAAEGASQAPPDTILAMLQARIGHLGQPARRALLAAAIFGQQFSDAGVAAVLASDTRPADAAAWLIEAETCELIEKQAGQAPQSVVEYSFRHALMLDAAYSLLTDTDRWAGHERAAEYLAGQKNPPAPKALIGYHHRAAGCYHEAFIYYQQAAEDVAQVSLFDEALRHYHTCQELLPKLAQTPDLLRQEADVLIGQVHCSLMKASPSVNLGRLARARAQLDSAVAQDGSVSTDERRLALLDLHAGRLHIYLNQFAEATRHLESALTRVRQHGYVDLLGTAGLLLARIYGLRGLVEKSVSALETVVASIHEDVEENIEWSRAYVYLAIFHALAGRGTTGYRYAKIIEDAITTIPSTDYKLVSLMNLGFFYYFACCFDSALRTLQQLRELANRSSISGHDPVVQIVGFELMSFTLTQQGHTDAALEFYKEAAIGRRQFSLMNWQDLVQAHHAQMLLCQGEQAAAAEHAQQALATADGLDSLACTPLAQRVWGQALAGLGAPASQVDEHLAASQRSAEQSGNAMQALMTQIAWGQLCLERGDGVTAHQYFTAAQQHIPDGLLPEAQAHFLPQIHQGLADAAALASPTSAVRDRLAAGPQ